MHQSGPFSPQQAGIRGYSACSFGAPAIVITNKSLPCYAGPGKYGRPVQPRSFSAQGKRRGGTIHSFASLHEIAVKCQRELQIRQGLARSVSSACCANASANVLELIIRSSSFVRSVEARCSRHWRGALHTCCSSDRWSCSHSRSEAHTGRRRFLCSLRSLP